MGWKSIPLKRNRDIVGEQVQKSEKLFELHTMYIIKFDTGKHFILILNLNTMLPKYKLRNIKNVTFEFQSES